MFLFLEHGHFLGFLLFFEVEGAQFLVLNYLELVFEDVVVDVALPNGEGLQELIFQVIGLLMHLFLEVVPHGGEVVGFIAHK